MLKRLLLALPLLLAGCAHYTPPIIHGQTLPPTGCYPSALLGSDCYTVLENTLRQVNGEITYREDDGPGNEFWRIPAAGEFGDCEDYALRLRERLNAQGIHNTYLALFITPDDRYHLNLFVGGWFLDYQESTPLSAENLWRNGYRWLRLGDEQGNWYRAYDDLQAQGLRQSEFPRAPHIKRQRSL